MKLVRFGGLAVLATTVALAAPAVAQAANEVTKWNEIAVSTVKAQPPLASAPNAGSIFVAMAQGAVYGAVNAVDRHGKPYLVNRSSRRRRRTRQPRLRRSACCTRCSQRARRAPDRLRRARSPGSRTVLRRTRASRSERWRPPRCSRRVTTAGR